VKIRLPYPISANRYWKQFYSKALGHIMQAPSDEAQRYKKQVALLVRAAGLRSCIPGLIELDVVLHPVRPKVYTPGREVRCMDLDNALKVTIDALKEIAYTDDSQVRRIVAERGEPLEGGGLTVEVKRYEVAAPIFASERAA
jgi:crossover junction endodeoxyribonuclease RusA